MFSAFTLDTNSREKKKRLLTNHQPTDVYNYAISIVVVERVITHRYSLRVDECNYFSKNRSVESSAVFARFAVENGRTRVITKICYTCKM